MRGEIYAKEDAAWNTFNTQKQAHLRDYLKAKATGVVRRSPAGRKCEQCKAVTVLGRAMYCESCAKQRQRDSQRASRERKRKKALLGDISSLSGAAQPQAFTNGQTLKKGPSATTIAEGASGNKL